MGIAFVPCVNEGPHLIKLWLNIHTRFCKRKNIASRHILWVQIYRQDKHLLHFSATVFPNVDYQLQNLGLSVVGVETGNGWLSVLEFWSYGEASIKAASAQSMTTGHWSRSLKSTAARDEHCPYWDLKPRFGFFDEPSVYYTVQKCEKMLPNLIPVF